MDLLLVDHTKDFNLTKDVFANSIEVLIDSSNLPLPSLLFHTIQKIQENYPALNGFLANVLTKIAEKKVWKDNKELWQTFLKCAKAVGSVAYSVCQLIQKKLKFFMSF